LTGYEFKIVSVPAGAEITVDGVKMEPEEGLVLYLKSENIVGNDWYDASGFGNHGKIHGK